jgi:hypothetical protein
MTSSLIRGCLLASVAVVAGCASGEDTREGVDLFPLYRDLSDAKSGERSVLWPLSNAEWDETKQSKHSWIFPFYVHWRTGTQTEGTLVPILPLYAHVRSPEWESTHYFPVWSRTTEKGSETTNVLLFLFETVRQQNSGALEQSSIFPLYQWKKGGSGQRFSLLRAINYWGAVAPGATNVDLDPVVSLFDVDSRVPAFYGAGDEPGIKIDVVHVFGKLVQLFHWGDAGSYTETRFLTIFASEPLSLFRRKVPHEGAPGADERRTTLFPLFDRMVGTDRSKWSVIAGAFGVEREQDRRTLRLLWIPIDLDDDEDEVVEPAETTTLPAP